MTDDSTAGTESAATERPFLRVVSGNPTDEEIAVLTAVLAAVVANTGSAAPAETGPRDDWGRPADLLRPEWQGGPSGFLNGNP